MSKNLRVELIEDDVLLARQFASSLRREGYEVHHSHHALEAIAFIDATPPDVIILDLLLPATTGFALLHELQSYDDTRSIPVVLCSSIVPSIEEVAPYGVKRIVNKATMHPDDLPTAVRAVLL